MNNPEAEKLDDPSKEAPTAEKTNRKQSLVPIVPFITITLLLLYVLLGGAVLNAVMVNDVNHEWWGYANVMYFILVSLLTIGYGDLVPRGSGFQVGTFVYLLFGFILMASCILSILDYVSVLQDRFNKRRQQES